MNTRLPALLLLVGLAACADHSPRVGTQLLVPDDVELHWSSAFNGSEDAIGAFVPVDVMVYEGSTGEPLADVEVELLPTDEGTWVVQEHGFVVVEPEACFQCDMVWDARRDQYVVFDEADPSVLEFLEGEGVALRTGNNGLVRVYLFVDDFARRDGGDDFSATTVLVSTGDSEDSFDLVPR